MKDSRTAYLVEGLLFLIYLAFGISWIAYSPIMGELEGHFHVSHAEAGSLISLVSLAKAFVPLFAGLLAARLGLKRALALGAGLAGIAAVLPFAPTFKLMLVGRFLFGVGGAIVVTLMGPTVMAWFSGSKLPMINGLNNVAVNAGITVAYFTTVPLVNHLGWRTTLVGFGLISIGLAIAWMLFGAEADTDSEAVAQDNPRLIEMLRRPETWWLGLAFTGPLSLYLALNTWLPSHYQEAFNLSRSAASQMTGLFNLVGIPAAIFGGLLTARLGLRKPLILLSGCIMPVAALGLFASPELSVRTISAVMLGASFFLYVAPLFTIPMELPGMTPRRVALMMGCIFSMAYIVSFLSPMLVGALRDWTGSFGPGLGLFALTSSVLAIGASRLPETGPKAR